LAVTPEPVLERLLVETVPPSEVAEPPFDGRDIS